jgi:hypothetical protein
MPESTLTESCRELSLGVGYKRGVQPQLGKPFVVTQLFPEACGEWGAAFSEEARSSSSFPFVPFSIDFSLKKWPGFVVIA